MKLIFCKNCNGVFNLTRHTKTCACGKSYGRYVDSINAIYAGKDAVMFAIDNFSFTARVMDTPNQTSKEFYDRMHGKDNVQCWVMRKGKPNYQTIQKLSLTEYKKR